MRKVFACIFSLWFILFLSNPVYAYLDAGSGSMILQIILGGLAGLAVILKLYWRRFLALLGIIKKKEDDSNPSASEQ